MDDKDDQKNPEGKEDGTTFAEGGMVTANLLSFSQNFLQRQLKDLLLVPDQKPSGTMAPHQPHPARTSPSLLWPARGTEAPSAAVPPAERPLNGTHAAAMTQQQHDGAPLEAAAAAALAEPSPAPQEPLGPGDGSAVQEQPYPQQQQQQPPAAAAAPAEPARPPPHPDPPDPVLPAAQQQPQQQQQAQQDPQLVQREAEAASALEGILHRISALDNEGWFYAPVREVDAPNYHKIIKQPMCFQVMRTKIQGRAYVSWNEVVRDFELICSNAMKYNQKRSRIHKLALVMLRAGKRLLVEVEPEGRRAIAQLNTAAAQQLAAGGAGACAPPAAPAEPQDTQALPSSLLRSDAGVTSTGVTPPSARILRSLSTMDTATTSDTPTRPGCGGWDPAQLDPPGAWGLPPAQDGYSSYSDTDMEECGEEGEAAGEQAPPHLAQAALALPYAGGATGASGGATTAAAPPAPGARDKAWKQTRRGVEWRVRWLELRLRELRHQRARCVERQVAQHVQQAAAAEPAAHQPRAHCALPDLQPPGMLGHPFFREHSVVGARADLAQQQQAQQAAAASPAAPQPPGPLTAQACPTPTSAATPAAAAAAPAAPCLQLDDPNYPARAHAALDLLDSRLSALRQEILSLQRPDSALLAGLDGGAGALGSHLRGGVQHHLGLLLTGRGGAGGSTGPGRPRGRAPVGTPRSRAGFSAASKPSSRERLDGNYYYRDEGGRLGKRRRQAEFDMGDVVAPVLGAPKYVERVQVKTIDTPKVRLLAAAEVKRCEAALAAYAANLRQGQPEEQAAQALAEACTPEEEAQAQAGGSSGFSSSSEEDISDEAYAARHRKHEEEERARYNSFAGQPLRNKKPTKVTKERSKLTKPGRGAALSPHFQTPTSAGALGLAPSWGATPSSGGLTPPAPPSAMGSAAGPQHEGLAPAAAPFAALPPRFLPPASLTAIPAQVPRGAAAVAAAVQGGSSAAVGASALPLLMVPVSAAMAAHMHAVAAAAAAAGQAASLAAPAAAAGVPGPGAAEGAAAAAASPSPAAPLLAPTAASAAAVQPLPPAANGLPATADGPCAHPLGADTAGAAAAAGHEAAAPPAGAGAPAAPGATLPVAMVHSHLPPALQAIIPHGPPAPSQMQPPPPREGRGSGRPRGRPRLRPKK